MKHLRLIALTIVICLSLAGGAYAQSNFIPNDRTINNDSFVNGFVAGYKDLNDFILRQNGTSPTISIVDGAHIAENGLAASGSTVNMSGGTVLRILGTTDAGTVNLSGGSVNGLTAGGQGMASMSGGTTVSVNAVQNGVFNVTGGQIFGGVQLFDSGMGKISGLTIGRMIDGNLVAQLLDVRQQSMLELDAVTVGMPNQGAIQLFDTGRVRLNNSTVHGGVFGQGQNTVEINGGNLSGGVLAYKVMVSGATLGGGISVVGEGAEGTISGTQTSDLSVGGNGSATLSVTGSTIASGGSVFNGGVLSASSTDFGGNLLASGGPAGASTLTLNGGMVGGNVSANNGTISASDARINGNVTAQASGVLASVTLNGGTVGGSVSATGGLSALRNAFVQINGSSITGTLTANDRSSITLVSGTVAGDATSKGGSFIGSLLDVQGGTITGNAVAMTPGAELKLSGGTVTGDVRGSSLGRVDISGGNVQGNLELSNNATGTMSGGSVAGKANFAGNRFSTFIMSGGSIAKDVTNTLSFTMQNGMMGGNLKLEGGNSTISGGSIAGDLTHSFGTVAMSAGTVGGDVISDAGNASLTISGGQVLGTLGAANNSTINVSGGFITGVGGVTDTATLNVSGTAVFNDQLNAFKNSTLNFSGGGAKSVGVTDQAKLNMSGSALILEGLQVEKSSRATLSGGKVTGNLTGLDGSVTTMTGGEVLNALTRQTSFLTVEGGAIRAKLSSHDVSVVTVRGGSISNNLSAEDNSTVFVEGTAFIGGSLLAQNNSTINMSGGSVVFASADGTATFNMSGGRVGEDLLVLFDGRLVLTGGTIVGKLGGSQKADIAMTGGVVGSIEAVQDEPGGGFTIGGGQIIGNAVAEHGSTILIAGGAIGGFVHARDNSTIELESVAAIAQGLDGFDFSTINMSGGSVGVNLAASGNATINLSAGTVGGNLVGLENSTINMSGGTVFGRGIFRNNAKFNFSGGTIRGGIQGSGALGLGPAADDPLNVTAFDDATINIIGFDLVSTLLDPNFEGMFSQYQLAGRLPDGTLINGGTLLVQNETQASFHLLTPEPGDIDADLDVDRADLALFAQHLGTSSGALWITGDFNGDGATTLADVALLQANLGKSVAPSPSASSAVPEPSMAGMVLLAAFILGCHAHVRVGMLKRSCPRGRGHGTP